MLFRSGISNCTFIGAECAKGSGYNTVTGDNNIGVGYQSLKTLSSGIGNLCLGYQCGNITTGDYNVCIGYGVTTSNQNSNTELRIGSTTNGTDNINWISGNASSNVGINDTNPISKLQIRIDGEINDADAQDSADFADYNLCLRKEAGTITSGTEIGLCFWISDSGYDPTNARTPGAAITHERIGSWSKGKLHFKTKQSTSSAANCVTAMTISDNGNIGIGTTNPGAPLQIDQSASNDAIRFVPENDGLTWRLYATNDNKFWIYLNNGGTKGGYVDGTLNESNLTFTGQHRCILNKNIDENSKGLIVSSTGKYVNINNSLNTNINESLPICTITNSVNDIKILGVISDKEDTNNNRTYNAGNFVTPYEKTNKNEQRMFINSLGEGAVWVCNKNGALTNGDYISSSSVSGYGMKQILNQNILANHTVAKITCDCDFSLTKIVKQKLKVITTTETYEENVTQDVQKTNTETKIRYDETLQKYVEEQITITTTEKEQVYDTFNLYDSSGNVLLDADGNARTHQVERKQTLTKTVTEIDYDANGDVQYEDDLDENGNQQMIFPLETRFLQADATQITETEYNIRLAAGEPVYIACFVGCTYHCG